MHRTRLCSRSFIWLPLLLSVAGCVTSREREIAVKPEIAHAYLDGKPERLRQHFYVALAQDQRNRVLNDMRLGLATFELGEYALAEQLFDDALQGIEAVYADNDQAKKARDLFVKELTKDFKGEPYERAMVYYYRGLLYLKAGDYENARASFKGGALQDAFAEDDQDRADFALMPYLQGWASKCSGKPSLAKEDFGEYESTGAQTAMPVPRDNDNLLVLVETGRAPEKYSATDPNQSKPRYLKFRKGSALPELPSVTYAGALPRPSYLIEDIYRQASTRGGRAFDSILAGKAQFQATADTVGNAALVGAAALATSSSYRSGRDRDAEAAAALALLLVGVVAKAAAAATEPNADTRYWDNLPDRIYGAVMPLPVSVERVSIQFRNSFGTLLRTEEAPIWRAGDCAIAWARAETAVPRDPRAPYSVPSEIMRQAVVIPLLPEPKPEPQLVATPEGKPPEREAGAGFSVEGSMDKIKSGFLELFSTKPANAAETKPAITADTKPATVAEPLSKDDAKEPVE
jgi:tetratricopeptide (TPR) repeat protein